MVLVSVVIIAIISQPSQPQPHILPVSDSKTGVSEARDWFIIMECEIMLVNSSILFKFVWFIKMVGVTKSFSCKIKTSSANGLITFFINYLNVYSLLFYKIHLTLIDPNSACPSFSDQLKILLDLILWTSSFLPQSNNEVICSSPGTGVIPLSSISRSNNSKLWSDVLNLLFREVELDYLCINVNN